MGLRRPEWLTEEQLIRPEFAQYKPVDQYNPDLNTQMINMRARGQDKTSEELRRQGDEAVDAAKNQGWDKLIDKGAEGFAKGRKMAEESALNKEQRATAQEQRAASQAQREQAGVETQKSRLELERMPQTLDRQSQLQEAQIASAQTQTEGQKLQNTMQQAQVESVQRKSEFLKSAASGLFDDAKPNETVEQYQLRAESMGEKTKIDILKRQMDQIDQDIAHKNRLLPLEMQQLQASTQAALANVQMQEVQTKIAKSAFNKDIHEQNIKSLANELRGKSPAEQKAYKQQLVATGREGIQGELAEAEEFLRQNATQAGIQQRYLEQLDPNEKYRQEAMEKMTKYTQAASRLQSLKEQFKDINFIDTPQQKDAIAQTQQILRDIGKGHMADRLEQEISWRDANTRGAAIDSLLKSLGSEFMADVNNTRDLGLLEGSPRLNNTVTQFQQIMERGGVTNKPPPVLPFANLNNVNFSTLGRR